MRLIAAFVVIAMFASEAFGETTRQDFQEYCRMMQGRWVNADEKIDGRVIDLGGNGDTVVSHAEINIIADGNAVEGVWYAGSMSGKWLVAWDPTTKQIRGFGVLSDGTITQAITTKSGDKWVQKSTWLLPDGTKKEFTSTLSVSEDGKTHSYENSFGGEPGVYRRVSH